MMETVEQSDVLRPFRTAFAGKQALVVGSGCPGIMSFPGGCGVVVRNVEAIGEVMAFDDLGEFDVLVIVEGRPIDKPEVVAMLGQAGFGRPVFYYPFPDYVRPTVLVGEQAFRTPGFNTGDLIRPAVDRVVGHLGRGLVPGFVPDLVCDSVSGLPADGDLTEIRHGVLIVGTRNGVSILPTEQLAFSFSSNRAAPFNKMNIFYKTPEGRIMVRHIPYQPDADAGVPNESAATRSVAQVLGEEPYLPGRLYSQELQDLLLKPGWDVQRVASWARPYMQLLRRLVQDGDGEWLEGRYLDLTPFNLLWHEGRLAMIDMEWKAGGPLPLRYVFFRGLYLTLARVPYVVAPVPGSALNIFGLCIAVSAELGLDTAGLLESFLELEAHYFGAVFPGDGRGPEDADLAVAYGKGTPQDLPPSLYPLLNLHLQVFVESETRGFCEEASTWRYIGLTHEPRIYSVPLPHFTADTVKLRIDPSDHSGMVRLHSIDLRTADGAELFHWTPFSRSDAELSGMVILNAGPRLPEAVTILTNYDPMLVFPLPAGMRDRPPGAVVLEMELSALSPELYDAVAVVLRELLTN
ncbi:MAG TPA: hypothetical protein VG605_00090 [Puia sp.]|nr:hypothetical protein [Puia sp.]